MCSIIGVGERLHKVLGQLGSKLWFPWQQKAPPPPMIMLRTANFKLPTETGRWSNVPIHERKCNLCVKNDLGDEFHYLLTCPFFKNDRKELLKPYYFTRPNIIKYKELLTSRNKMVLIKLSKFMNIIISQFL